MTYFGRVAAEEIFGGQILRPRSGRSDFYAPLSPPVFTSQSRCRRVVIVVLEVVGGVDHRCENIFLWEKWSIKNPSARRCVPS